MNTRPGISRVKKNKIHSLRSCFARAFPCGCWITGSWITGSWITGSLDHWITGSLDRWITGSLDHWIADHWITGSLDHWIAGSLITGSLDRWITGERLLGCHSVVFRSMTVSTDGLQYGLLDYEKRLDIPRRLWYNGDS